MLAARRKGFHDRRESRQEREFWVLWFQKCLCYPLSCCWAEPARRELKGNLKFFCCCLQWVYIISFFHHHRISLLLWLTPLCNGSKSKVDSVCLSQGGMKIANRLISLSGLWSTFNSGGEKPFSTFVCQHSSHFISRGSQGRGKSVQFTVVEISFGTWWAQKGWVEWKVVEFLKQRRKKEEKREEKIKHHKYFSLLNEKSIPTVNYFGKNRLCTLENSPKNPVVDDECSRMENNKMRQAQSKAQLKTKSGWKIAEKSFVWGKFWVFFSPHLFRSFPALLFFLSTRRLTSKECETVVVIV